MRAAPLIVPEADRELLEQWTRSSTMKAGQVQRARIVLLAGDGVPHVEIARRFAISRQTVINWRARWRVAGRWVHPVPESVITSRGWGG